MAIKHFQCKFINGSLRSAQEMAPPTLSTCCWFLTPPDWSWGSLTPVLMTLWGMWTLPPPPPPWPCPGFPLPRARYLTRPIWPRPTGSARSSPTSVKKKRKMKAKPNYLLLSPIVIVVCWCVDSNWILIPKRTESDWLGLNQMLL